MMGRYKDPESTRITDSDGNIWELEPNGGMPVNLQDQTSPTIIVRFNQVVVTTTLAAVTAIDDLTIDVVDATGIIVGHYLGIFDTVNTRFYVGTVLGVAGTVLTLDTPLDWTFSVGDTVGTGISNMAVDGSVTSQIFTVRGADPGLDVTIDITRLIFQCITADIVDLSRFGDIVGGITNGLVLRRVDGTSQNIFNVKTNGDIAGIMYDWTPHAALNPVQGVDGFVSRLTFGGQNKMGVVLRIGPGESLEFIVQDDLSSLTSFIVTAEGHVVVDGS